MAKLEAGGEDGVCFKKSRPVVNINRDISADLRAAADGGFPS